VAVDNLLKNNRMKEDLIDKEEMRENRALIGERMKTEEDRNNEKKMIYKILGKAEEEETM